MAEDDDIRKAVAAALLRDSDKQIDAATITRSGVDANNNQALEANELVAKFGITTDAANAAISRIDANGDNRATDAELNTFLEANIGAIQLNPAMRAFIQSAMADQVLDKDERMALSLAMAGVSFEDMQRAGVTGGQQSTEAIASAVTSAREAIAPSR